MPSLTKTLSFARRLSVFYLFTIIFSAFFGVFYYKFIPDNQAELNGRGFRILNQLTDNIVERDSNLTSVFSNVDTSVSTHPQMIQQLKDQLGVDVIKPDSLNRRRLQVDSLGGASPRLVYRISAREAATMPVATLIEPILQTRDDLFESYALLQPSSRSKDSARLMRILYIQHALSASPEMSTDSAIGLQKNNDLADISTIAIGGKPYTLFYQPFNLGGRKVVLGGLIQKESYDRMVRTLPNRFVVGMVMVILLGFILLPFAKVFFISPKENLYRRDVVAVVFSIFIGSALVVLSGCYFLADYSSTNRISYILSTMADSLENDIHTELDSAGAQLDHYAASYEYLPHREVLCNSPSTTPEAQRIMDSILVPYTYPTISRLFWFDSTGETIAKWNPYNFAAALTPVKDYPFYTLLLDKSREDTGKVLTAGRSNITGEFQFYLSRQKENMIEVPNRDAARKSFGIVMAFQLKGDLHLPLPKGYGFCLVNNSTANVVMHSDERRNLLENLYQETNHNAKLINCLNLSHEDVIPHALLYGANTTMYVKPLRGHPFSVVTFYDMDTCSGNVFRMIHFASETIMYVSVAILICLFISTSSPSKPSKLSFTLSPVEWIRPLKNNTDSYNFNFCFFSWQILLAMLISLVMWALQLDVRIVFYISVLMPFYAVWGFLAGRKKDNRILPEDAAFFKKMLVSPRRLGIVRKGRKEHKPVVHRAKPWYVEVVTSARLLVVVIAVLNMFIFRLIAKLRLDHPPSVAWMIIIFQVLTLLGMGWLYHAIFVAKRLRFNLEFQQTYLLSLSLSILAISVIPSTGFTWYGWVVEKIQYARKEQLSIAGKNIERMKYLSGTLLGNMKPSVLHALNDSLDYTNKLKASTAYLAGQKLDYDLKTNEPCDTLHDPDRPYITLLDELFVVTSGEYDSYSIPSRASDSSWRFTYCSPGTLTLFQCVPGRRRTGFGESGDSLVTNFKVSSEVGTRLFSWRHIGVFHGTVFFLMLIMVMLLVPRILAMSVNRLFLLDLFDPDEEGPPVEDLAFKYFGAARKPVPDFKVDDHGMLCGLDQQEEYVLRTVMDQQKIYQQIWDELPRQERYFLFDFARDGYVNYKDIQTVISLEAKGLITYDRCCLRLFAISFREFLMQKKGSEEVQLLQDRFAVPGIWSTIRIPVLIVISACALLLVMTQENVSHQITVLVGSVGAIVPVILEVVKRVTTKST